MRKNIFLLVFIWVALMHLVGTLFNIGLIPATTKPLLLPLLMVFYTTQSSINSSSINKLFLTGLAFSWLGDVLLMFQQRDGVFFILGLVAFLTAHIFYIVFFVKQFAKPLSIKWSNTVGILIYALMIFSLLQPKLGAMQLPVLAYTLVISTMLWCSVHLPKSSAKPFLVAGALLFVISDSLLAINKFYQPFAAAGFCIMLTYIAAQLLLVMGAIKVRVAKKI